MQTELSASLFSKVLILRGIGYRGENLINVEGGILAWVNEIDPRLPTY